MSAFADYRVSRVVILCKDCGRDVGPYPARHKCEDAFSPADEDVPPLPSNASTTGSTATSTAAESFGAFRANLMQKWEQMKPKQGTESTNSAHDSKLSPASSERRPSDAGSENSPGNNQPKWVATALDKVKAFTNKEEREESDEDEDPDHTPVAKALRAYYKKAGRPEPPWLKIDPNRPKPVRRPKPRPEPQSTRNDSKWSVNEEPERPVKNNRRRPATQQEPAQSLRGNSGRRKEEDEEEDEKPDYMAAFARNRERLKKMSDPHSHAGQMSSGYGMEPARMDSRSPAQSRRQAAPLHPMPHAQPLPHRSPRGMERPSPPREARRQAPHPVNPRMAPPPGRDPRLPGGVPMTQSPGQFNNYPPQQLMDPRSDPRRPSLPGGSPAAMRYRHPSPSPATGGMGHEQGPGPVPRQRQRSAGAVMDPRLDLGGPSPRSVPSSRHDGVPPPRMHMAPPPAAGHIPPPMARMQYRPPISTDMLPPRGSHPQNLDPRAYHLPPPGGSPASAHLPPPGMYAPQQQRYHSQPPPRQGYESGPPPPHLPQHVHADRRPYPPQGGAPPFPNPNRTHPMHTHSAGPPPPQQFKYAAPPMSNRMIPMQGPPPPPQQMGGSPKGFSVAPPGAYRQPQPAGYADRRGYL